MNCETISSSVCPSKSYSSASSSCLRSSAAAENENPGHSQIGRIASGDQFICYKAQKEKIIADTGAICAEMEGAAIAHTAYRNSVPFVIIRAISDKADDTAEMDYPTFEAIAAQRCAAVTTQLAKLLQK